MHRGNSCEQLFVFNNEDRFKCFVVCLSVLEVLVNIRAHFCSGSWIRIYQSVPKATRSSFGVEVNFWKNRWFQKISAIFLFAPKPSSNVELLQMQWKKMISLLKLFPNDNCLWSFVCSTLQC